MSTVPYSWSLPYFGGLASPIASKSQLYNAWMNSGNSSSPLVDTAANNALAQAKALAEAKAKTQQLAQNPLYYSSDGGGTGLGGTDTNSVGNTGVGDQNGFGFGNMGQTAASVAGTIGSTLAGAPSAISGALGSVAGDLAGPGLSANTVANVGVNAALSAFGPLGTLASLAMSAFGIDKGMAVEQAARALGLDSIADAIGLSNPGSIAAAQSAETSAVADAASAAAQDAAQSAETSAVADAASAASASDSGMSGMGDSGQGGGPDGPSGGNDAGDGSWKRGGLVRYSEHVLRSKAKRRTK